MAWEAPRRCRHLVVENQAYFCEERNMIRGRWDFEGLLMTKKAEAPPSQSKEGVDPEEISS
jgi:hypothetical protein